MASIDQGTSDLYQGQPLAAGVLGTSLSSAGMYTLLSQSTQNSDMNPSITMISSKLADGYFGNIPIVNTYPNYFTFSDVTSDVSTATAFYVANKKAAGLAGNINSSSPSLFTFSDINSSPGTGGTVVTTYYKVRGYYVAGAVYETYVTTTLPGTNPSGHTLIDLTIVSTWRV